MYQTEETKVQAGVVMGAVLTMGIALASITLYFDYVMRQDQKRWDAENAKWRAEQVEWQERHQARMREWEIEGMERQRLWDAERAQWRKESEERRKAWAAENRERDAMRRQLRGDNGGKTEETAPARKEPQ